MRQAARLIALSALLGLGVCGALAEAATPLHTHAATGALKTCPPGYVDAQLSWGEKCLHAGEFCKVGNPEYHQYGFDCPASGHLVYYSAPASPTRTSRLSAATAVSIFPSASAARYDRRSQVTKIGSLWSGFLGGARATYADYGSGRPQATVSVYLFSSTANAASAFVKSCPPGTCFRPSGTAPIGLQVRFRTWPTNPGHCLLAAAERVHVLVLVHTCAVYGDDGKHYTTAQLEYDAGYEIGLFHSRAKQLLGE